MGKIIPELGKMVRAYESTTLRAGDTPALKKLRRGWSQGETSHFYLFDVIIELIGLFCRKRYILGC
jgi:hypothetical protein